MDSQQPSKESIEEDIRQEVAYPPPPSYYEKLSLPVERPPLPEKHAPIPASQTQPGVLSSPNTMSGSYYRPLPTGRQPAYPSSRSNSYLDMTPRNAIRTGHRQTWIIVAIISVSVLLLCGASGWALANIFGAVSQEGVGANQVAQDFYQRLLQQDYNGAYADLQIDGLTASVFSQDAQAVDAHFGPMLSFNIDTTAFNSASSTANTTHWQITIHVTRQQTSYSVPISIDTAHGSWKITSIDLNKF